MIWALVFLPLLAALAAMLIRSDRIRRALLTATAATHAALTAVCWIAPPAVAPDAWVGLDAAGRLFLGIASLLFLVNVLLAAPLVTTDRVNQVRQLQAASATGRRLLRVQLAATSGVSIIATAFLIGLTSLPLARFGFDAFWGTGIQSFTSASLYPSVTLGQYCWLLTGLLMIVGILAGLIGFILSRANRGYPTLSISLMVALALGFPTLSKMLGTSPALSYESPLGRVLGTPFATMLALTTLAAAALAVCLIQVRRERGIDVEDQ